MFKIYRYINLLNKRYLSISKSYLIECSQNIEELLKLNDDKSCSSSSYFSNLLNKIHIEYPSRKVALSTKEIYQINSSKFNCEFLKFENERKNEIGLFKEKDLILSLQYIRYLEICFIYRLITYDINLSLKELISLIINLTKTKTLPNSFSLTCELIFFINLLSSKYSLTNVKSLLSSTRIINYLINYLDLLLNENKNILLINLICFTLKSIIEIPSSSTIDLWPYLLLKYLFYNKSNSLSIINYLILIQHSSTNQNLDQFHSLLNKYLNQIAIYEENLNIICQLFILISSSYYSNENFQRNIYQKIENYLKNEKIKLNDIKLCSKLIYYIMFN